MHARLATSRPVAKLPAGGLKTAEGAKERVEVLLGIIKDMDELLGTQDLGLFGKWVEAARGWGASTAEKDLYEFNARNLVVGSPCQFRACQSRAMKRGARGAHWGDLVESHGGGASVTKR